MKITHVVIHELEKETGKIGASLSLFDSTVDNMDSRVIKLISELNQRYRYRSETYGVFDKKNPTPFHSSFDKYEKSRKEIDFVEFSKLAAADLKTRVDSIAPAKGGYLIFAHYEQNKKFVAVFLVRNTTGISFRKNMAEKKFDINDVVHIDFENLAMACRIGLDSFRRNDIRYLSFIGNKGDDMSQYFTRWISSTDTETNEQDTNLFYDILSRVTPPIDDGATSPIERHVLLDRAYSAVKNSPGRLINIRSLSTELFGDEELLPTFISDQGITINGEFKAHNGVLKKFIRIRAKADEVELSFSHSAYKKIVRFDKRNPSQIIIESENLVREIKSLLQRG